MTLTFKPEHQYNNLLTAMGPYGQDDWEEMREYERFRKVDAAAYKHVQRYFKRLRKAGLDFRYFIVSEPHKSGLPHYHALLHCRASVRWRDLDKWEMGFASFKLAEKHSIGYVCKYISKTLHCKVKASQRYGLQPKVETVKKERTLERKNSF